MSELIEAYEFFSLLITSSLPSASLPFPSLNIVSCEFLQKPLVVFFRGCPVSEKKNNLQNETVAQKTKQNMKFTSS